MRQVEPPLRVRLCASSKPQGGEGNPSLCTEDPNSSYSLLFYLTPHFMVASSGSSKLELGNQMPSQKKRGGGNN